MWPPPPNRLPSLRKPYRMVTSTAGPSRAGPHMAEASTSGLTGACTRESGDVARPMGRGSSLGLLAPPMKVSSETAEWRGMGFSPAPMEPPIGDPGWETGSMARDARCMQTGTAMREPGEETFKMAREGTRGATGISMLGSGKMGSFVGEVY